MSIRSAFAFLLMVSLIAVDPTLASKKYNRYLTHIFNKYGSNGEMSFEGLEHLMFSLGLGEIEFNPLHTLEQHHPNGYKVPDITDISDNDVLSYHINATKKIEIKNVTSANNGDNNEVLIKNSTDNDFKSLHDPKHRHPRHHDSPHSNPVGANVCLPPKEILKLLVDEEDIERSKRMARSVDDSYNELMAEIKFTPESFMKICPVLLSQIEEEACKDRPIIKDMKNDTQQMYWSWVYASISIFILSSCGLLGIALVPLMQTVAYQEILRYLIAVAVGTLGGDALMHLLPHALFTHSEGKAEKSESGDEHEDHNGPVLLCACAFATMLFMYTIENLLPLLKGEKSGGHGHSHSHSHGHSHEGPKEAPSNPTKEINTMLNEEKEDKKGKSAPLTPVAFMVVIGDGLHNLTDGLAIGAAFAMDPVTGMATAFAVLCHELPHELGDFALLLQTGVSIKRAVLLNIVSSVLSFIGMAIGLLIAGLHGNMAQWIYAATAGSFLYIALADLVPAMSMESRGIKDFVIQAIGILTGGIIMLYIALNEKSLEELFK